MVFHPWPAKLGACLAALSLAAAALAAERPTTLRKPQQAVAVPVFAFTGRVASPQVEVPAFAFTGPMSDPVATVPAFAFGGRMPDPMVDVAAFAFVGNGGDIVVATPPLQLIARPLPTTLSTGTLAMTGRGVASQHIDTPPLQLIARPLPTSISTGTLTMTGRGVASQHIDTPPLQLSARPLPAGIRTGTLAMTGRRAETAASVNTGDDTLQVQPPRPVFRLFRVVPLGSGATSIYGGTNPFDIADVRNDVGQATQVTPPAPATPLTLASALPSHNVKGATATAQIDVNTTAQALSWSYDGVGNLPNANSALTLSVTPGNIQGRLDPVGSWSVVSRDYAQPFTAAIAIATCTVLRAASGAYYKLNVGLTPAGAPAATGFQITSLAGWKHDTTQPACP